MKMAALPGLLPSLGFLLGDADGTRSCLGMKQLFDLVSVESGEKEPARRTSLSAALLADQAYGFERCFPRA